MVQRAAEPQYGNSDGARVGYGDFYFAKGVEGSCGQVDSRFHVALPVGDDRADQTRAMLHTWVGFKVVRSSLV